MQGFLRSTSVGAFKLIDQKLVERAECKFLALGLTWSFQGWSSKAPIGVKQKIYLHSTCCGTFDLGAQKLQ
jgi:hypothetical protein